MVTIAVETHKATLAASVIDAPVAGSRLGHSGTTTMRTERDPDGPGAAASGSPWRSMGPWIGGRLARESTGGEQLTFTRSTRMVGGSSPRAAGETSRT